MPTSAREAFQRPLYTFAEADRLASVTRGTSRRWLAGYSYRGGHGVQPAVTPRRVEPEAVSFTDLLEVVAIGRLEESGFSLRAIRRIVEYCRDALGVDRPLTSLRFRISQQQIFVERRPFLLEVGRSRGSQAWAQVLEPFLQELDYEEQIARAVRWWPIGRDKPIVVDPEYGFGLPVIAGSGVRTETILERFRAGDLEDQIARDFNLTSVEVERALQFEIKLAA